MSLSDEERFRARRAFAQKAKLDDARHSPAVMKSALRPALAKNHSALDAARLVMDDPITRVGDAARRRLGASRPTMGAEEFALPTVARPLTGARDNNRGGAYIQAFTTGTAFLPQTIVESPKNPGQDAETLAITLGFDVLNGTVANDQAVPIMPACNLLWGVGGAEFTAEVDWLQGTVLYLTASYARVSISFPYSFAFIGIGAAIVTYRFSANIGYGSTRPSTHVARRTTALSTLAAGVTDTLVPVPPFATSYTILTDAAVVTMRISQEVTSSGSGSFAVNTYTNQSNGSNQDASFPIVCGTRMLAVTNLGAAAVDYVVLFNLSL